MLKHESALLVRTGIGQDSHRFLPEESAKPCVIGGVIIDDVPGFSANSDGDIVLHALCNAISSLTGQLILGGIADDLCLKDGITDSAVYLKKGLETLEKQKITHVAFTIEGKRPHLKNHILKIRENISNLLGLHVSQVGLTATTGEGLTDFACGDGMQAFCVLTTQEHTTQGGF